MRQLQYLMDTCSEYRDAFRERAAAIQDSPALQDLALSRSEVCDEVYHELDVIMRTMAFWR